MAPGMLFGELARFFERISQVVQGKPNKKRDQLAKFMDDYKRAEKTSADPTPSLYPLIRLVCPDLDKQGRIYKVKHQKLAQLLIQGIPVAKTSNEAKRMHGYQTMSQKGQGNFSNVVFDILDSTPGRCAEDGKGERTIGDVSDFLDKLGQEKDQVQLFKDNMTRYTAKEWKWIVRIILRELKVGISEGTTLEAFHPDAKEFYGTHNNDMKQACAALKDRNVRVSSSIELFRPFVPQMCSRPKDLEAVERMCQNRDFYFEKKMDGERVQFHKDGDQVKIFTRKSNDYTSLYSWITKEVLRKNLIKAKKCILDGEIVGWWPGDDQQCARYLPPTSLKTIALKSGGSFKDAKESGPVSNWSSDIAEISGAERQARCTLCLSIFDILQEEDNSLAKIPLSDRLKRLDAVCTWEKHLFERTAQRVGKSVEEAFQAILDIGAEEEGVVLKDPSSLYQVGGRNGAGWMKLKPDYLSGANDSFDLIIMGGNFGQGAVRSGRVMQYIVGVIDKKQAKPTFRSFTKVGTGLSREHHFAVAEKIAKIAVPFRELVKSKSVKVKSADGSSSATLYVIDNGYRIEFSSGAMCFFSDQPRSAPDVVFDPLKLDTVVEVIADRRMIPGNLYIAGRCTRDCPAPIEDTQSHPGMGWTLRFPRMQRIREKRLEDALNMEGLWEAIVRSVTGQEAVRGGKNEETFALTSQSKSPRKVKNKESRPAQEKKVGGASSARTCPVERSSDCMSGFEVYIIDNGEVSALEEAILSARRMGADVTAEFDKRSTTHVISLYDENELHKKQKDADRDVIRPDWLFECEGKDPPQALALEPRFMWHASKATEESFKDRFDVFGDSYTVEISDETVLDILMRGAFEDGGQDGELDLNSILEEVETDLAATSFEEKTNVQAWINPARTDVLDDPSMADDGGAWVKCVVQEYLVGTGEFVVCCVDGTHALTTRHVVSPKDILMGDATYADVIEWSVFGEVRALFVEYVVDPALSLHQARTRLAKLNLIAGGGVPLDSYEQRVTHVVVDLGVGGTTEGLKEELEKHHRVQFGVDGPWVVDVSWVLDGVRDHWTRNKGALDLLDEENGHYLLLDKVTGLEKKKGRAMEDVPGTEEDCGVAAKKQRIT
uniref:DNA ligase 4 n=1 Tax=Hemiselmis andersenii TaxID=464988 RepID=A0A6T8PEB9_HEMAN|mmetsp:Transcript_4971/g.11777  ORF Transcript_4971/g.11777 Transcript_4971/m.11777 type:complete len:1115 (+) Transcript_4971:129-3473(+)